MFSLLAFKFGVDRHDRPKTRMCITVSSGNAATLLKRSQVGKETQTSQTCWKQTLMLGKCIWKRKCTTVTLLPKLSVSVCHIFTFTYWKLLNSKQKIDIFYNPPQQQLHG